MSQRQALDRCYHSADTARPGFSLYPSEKNASQQNCRFASGFSYKNQEQAFETEPNFGCIRGCMWAAAFLAAPYGLLVWWLWPAR